MDSETGTTSNYLTFYDVKIGDTTLQMPLNNRLRTGMMMRDMLMFYSGNKTFVFDPSTNVYYGEHECKKDKTEKKKIINQNGEDEEMPEMKNAELFTMKDGTVYLIGGEMKF